MKNGDEWMAEHMEEISATGGGHRCNSLCPESIGALEQEHTYGAMDEESDRYPFAGVLPPVRSTDPIRFVHEFLGLFTGVLQANINTVRRVPEDSLERWRQHCEGVEDDK